MPLFRIMGGGGPSRSSTGQPPQPSPQQPTTLTGGARATATAAGPSPSRYTYPGQRMSATNPLTTASSQRQQPPLSSVSPPARSDHVILRGSNVPSTPTTTGSTPDAPSSSQQQQQSAAAAASSAAPSTTAVTTTTRPGAYQVSRTLTAGLPAQVYRVVVPNGVRPGTEFTVHAGPRRVRVRCPPTCAAGQSLQITLPPEPETHYVPLRMAPLTAAPAELLEMICLQNSNKKGSGSTKSLSSGKSDRTAAHAAAAASSSSNSAGGGAVAMTPEVQRVNQQAALSGGSAQTFLVTIPPNIHAGMTFVVNVNQQRFMVTCPANAGPNQKVRIVPPNANSHTSSNGSSSNNSEPPEAAPTTQVFEVTVPPGIQPGQPFALLANGQRVLVTCPPNVSAGQRIRFQLPVQSSSESSLVSNIQLCYKEGGWMRTIRMPDMKFQWVRLDQQKEACASSSSLTALSTKKDDVMDDESDDDNKDGDVAAAATEKIGMLDKFDFGKSAYVRKITFLEGNDARMRTGCIDLVPANEAVVDSKLVVNNRTLLSYADIVSIQGKPLEEKTEWFQRICTQLTLPWDDGHVKIVVRRKHLLLDSVDAVMSLSRDDLRKRWRIEFLGEPGVEAGGLTREWFELVTDQIYDPDFGLWKPTINNQMCLDVNPASGISCPDDHLVYFRFLGRVLGRALFDQQLVKGHMTRTIYRHLLGWPVTFEDIENQDEDYYKSLKKLSRMSHDAIPNMCLDFTVTEEHMGAFTDMELIEGGRDREVNSANLAEYLELNLKHRLMGRTKLQLTELLLGFFDIVPEPALTVYDANELELILCGLPVIDIEDWKSNTLYSGCFSNQALREQVVKWFWEIVTDEFDTEMKARLLQFVTGTSGVPSRGFSVLQGIDGNIKKFTIHGVDLSTSAYPRAHTCFNRIDLPLYSSKQELHEKLRTTITLCGVGFDME